MLHEGPCWGKTNEKIKYESPTGGTKAVSSPTEKHHHHFCDRIALPTNRDPRTPPSWEPRAAWCIVGQFQRWEVGDQKGRGVRLGVPLPRLQESFVSNKDSYTNMHTVSLQHASWSYSVTAPVRIVSTAIHAFFWSVFMFFFFFFSFFFFRFLHFVNKVLVYINM